MEQGPRTKRKYTVSDKVRAANRLNLEKARAVGKEVLYRPTEKRRKACRANLLIARQSPNYQPNVRHGLRAVNLRESAPQVGERQEEYDRHMELVEGVLPAEQRRERNGVQGLGQALWRRRRLFGSRAHRETLGFYLELEKAAVDGLCPASVRDLSFSSWHLFAGGADPRLEQTMDRLDQRLVRVAEAYLSEESEELIRVGVWEQPYRPDFLEQPPEVIGNALVGAGEVRRRMEEGRNGDGEMKPADWFDWDLQGSDTKSGLLKEFVRQGYRLPDARREEDFALHLRLIEAAFFGDRQAGFGLAGSGGVPASAGVGEGDPVPVFGLPCGRVQRSIPGVIPSGAEPGGGDVAAPAGVRPAGGEGSPGPAGEVGAGGGGDVGAWAEESERVVAGSARSAVGPTAARSHRRGAVG